MIQNGIVQNIAVWDGVSSWSPQGYVLADITSMPQVDMGWAYDGKNFSAAQRIIEVDPIQARFDEIEEKLSELEAAQAQVLDPVPPALKA